MERNTLIDKLKGYACFLVLFGHVIMGIRVAGIGIPSFFEGLEKFIWSFHVALFMFLSGVVYKITGEWKSKQTRAKFITHKLLGLGVPYVIFSAIYILINMFVGATNTQSSVKDIFMIWKTPVAQYWFLYALLILFIFWTLLTPFLKNWQVTVLLVAITYLLPLAGVSLGSMDSLQASALVFGIGTCIEFKELVEQKKIVKCASVVTHVVLGIVLIVFQKISTFGFKEAFMVIGIYASVMLISLIQNNKLVSKFFDFMNHYSFQIYLLHTIFTAGARIVLLRLGVTNWMLHILAGTALGIACPVVAAVIAKKIPVLDYFFFPTKMIKRMKSK
jgi:fucose 4-O-acetylase-like acetyltransferase